MDEIDKIFEDWDDEISESHLTVERLLEFGFELMNINTYPKSYKIRGKGFSSSWFEVIGFSGGIFISKGIEIKYVDELENIYFLYTKKKLKDLKV